MITSQKGLMIGAIAISQRKVKKSKMKIIIKGIPLQKQSAKFARVGKFVRSYQPKKINNWVAQARLQILNQLPQHWLPLRGEVEIKEIIFVFPPLKSWTKKLLLTLQQGKRIYKPTKPDLDNLCKNTWDCCNGILWVDDAQIVEVNSMKKIYGEVPRIELSFKECKDDDGDQIKL